MSFNAWLRKQKHRQDAVGDLARDMVQDKCWPPARCVESFRAHMYHEHQASYAALDVVNRAWAEYQQSKQP